MLATHELARLCERLGLSAEARTIVETIRSLPPTRRVRSAAGNVSARYPSRKMRVTIRVAHAGDVPGSNDNGNTNQPPDVPHKQAAAASSVPNVLRCHRITRASMSTMSHQLAASRGLPQTAPGLAMKAPVASQS